MMTRIVKNDGAFYALLFCVWAATLTGLHGGHRFFGVPLASVAPGDPQVRQREMLVASLGQLYQALATEDRPAELPHLLHNIGLAYFDLHQLTGQAPQLDSARVYMQQSVARRPAVARFHYNLGRVFTEYGNHPRAKEQYELALAADPRHVLALHNLGLLTYFELHELDTAERLFRRALAIDPRLPICNYALGKIDGDLGRYDSAAAHLEREIAVDTGYDRSGPGMPTHQENVSYARELAHEELAILYSTRLRDREKAQAHLRAYLGLEGDEGKRREMMAKMGRFWVVGRGQPAVN